MSQLKELLALMGAGGDGVEETKALHEIVDKLIAEKNPTLLKEGSQLLRGIVYHIQGMGGPIPRSRLNLDLIAL
jgi:hypothetical protein